jgi:RsmE family RNA methyltransferase
VECLYAPDLVVTSQTITLGNEEVQHARALRLRQNDGVLLTNGVGLCAAARVLTHAQTYGQARGKELYQTEIQCGIEEILPEYGERPYRLIAALGVLDSRERAEFAIEKAVELGVHDFVPLLTENSERNRTKADRIHTKILAATKQCKRSRLMTFHAPISVDAFCTFLPADAVLVVADAGGISPYTSASSITSALTIAIAVGAEGGFTATETSLLRRMPNSLLWTLAPNRLRAETALLAGLSGVAALRGT